MGKISAQTETIKELMYDLKRGKYNIPRFQREFVWKHSKIVGLLESIDKNFPFGIILLADSKDSSLAGRNSIVDLICNNGYKNNGKVVVDGQQRITSIAIVYYAYEISQQTQNIDKKIVSVVNRVYKNIAFYNENFYDIKDLKELIESSGNSAEHATAEANMHLISIKEISAKVKQKLDKRQVFTHTLTEWNDGEIIDIFTALNQKVVPLTHIDLMNGSMFNVSNNKFDLINFIKVSNKEWSNWGEIKQPLFVQLIKIFSDLYLRMNGYKDVVEYKSSELVKWSGDKIKVEKFIENKELFLNIVKDTMKILEKKYHFISSKHIPKDVYFITVFALICKVGIKEKEFDNLLHIIISKVSKRLINGDYASSPNAKAQYDINRILIPTIDGDEITIEEITEWEMPLESKLSQLKYTNKGDAVFKLVLSILSLNQPRMLFKDEIIDTKPSVISKADFDIHHFIPTKSNLVNDYSLKNKVDYLGNLTLLSSDENRNKVKDKNIFEYLKESKEILGESLFIKTMESHLYNISTINEIIKLGEVDNPINVTKTVDKLHREKLAKIQEKIIKKYFQ